MDVDNDLFDCDICCEKFDESGAHVPLVLPCGHTLCGQCVGRLLTHVCPTCKHPLQHPTSTSTSTPTSMVFPRNNWLIRCLLANQSSKQSSIQSCSKKIEESGSSGSSMSKIRGKKQLPPGAPTLAAIGQRVLFKQLDRACRRSRADIDSDNGNSDKCSYNHTGVSGVGVAPSSEGSSHTHVDISTVRAVSTAQLQDKQERERKEKQHERLILQNLSRICKEKKAQDSNFDQKRFVKEGLIMSFGEARAKSIMHQVFDRIKLLREKKTCR